MINKALYHNNACLQFAITEVWADIHFCYWVSIKTQVGVIEYVYHKGGTSLGLGSKARA